MTDTAPAAVCARRAARRYLFAAAGIGVFVGLIVPGQLAGPRHAEGGVIRLYVTDPADEPAAP